MKLLLSVCCVYFSFFLFQKSSYITLDVACQTGSFIVNSNSRSRVCAFDIGMVVQAIVQLKANRRKKDVLTRFAFIK